MPSLNQARRLAEYYLALARDMVEHQHLADLDAYWPHLRAALAYTDRPITPIGGLLNGLICALADYAEACGLAPILAAWCRQAVATRAQMLQICPGAALSGLWMLLASPMLRRNQQQKRHPVVAFAATAHHIQPAEVRLEVGF